MIEVWMITIAFWAIIACLVLGAIAWAASACCWIWIAWRERETSKEPEDELSSEPVPYWPAATIDALATMITCPACPGRRGQCTCSGPCGDLACTGGFDPADLEFMERLWLKGTDQ